MQRSLLVILVIVFLAVVFALAFIHFYRIYKQLRIRHLKPIIPPPGTIPESLEQHQELAFVLTHGVEAYNDLRRERHRRERAEAQAQITTDSPTVGNTRRRADSSSLHSSSSSAGETSIEALPAYSSEPADGDVGYGWRAAGLGIEQGGLFSAPALTGNSSSATTHPFDPLLHPLSSGSTTFYLPPVYRASSMQSALVSTDNSPSVTLPRSRRRSSQHRAVPAEEQREHPPTSQTETTEPSATPLPPSPPLSSSATSHSIETILPGTFVLQDSDDLTAPGIGAVTEEPEHDMSAPAVVI